MTLPALAALLATAVHPAWLCPEPGSPAGPVVEASPGDNLQALLDGAEGGTTLLLADGIYPIRSNLQLRRDGITLRSRSGSREKVVLDGAPVGEEPHREGLVPEVLAIRASDVTVADITVRHARDHGIHVSPSGDRGIKNILLHNLHVYDCGQQLIKVNSNGNAANLQWADSGTLECSLIEFQNTGLMQYLEGSDSYYTGGIDVHGGEGWIIRGNTFRNIWRQDKAMEHAIHLWSRSRGSLVENNHIENCWRGIGLGMKTGPSGLVRSYPDRAGEEPYFDHVGGMVRNNVIYNAAGFRLETGIELMKVEGTEVYHNTVVSEEKPFSGIEYRWAGTRVILKNNLCSHDLRARDGAHAESEGNLPAAPLELFRNPRSGDFHLRSSATQAIGRGIPLAGDKAGRDMDGQARDGEPDIGADEFSASNALLSWRPLETRRSRFAADKAGFWRGAARGETRLWIRVGARPVAGALGQASASVPSAGTPSSEAIGAGIFGLDGRQMP